MSFFPLHRRRLDVFIKIAESQLSEPNDTTVVSSVRIGLKVIFHSLIHSTNTDLSGYAVLAADEAQHKQNIKISTLMELPFCSPGE